MAVGKDSSIASSQQNRIWPDSGLDFSCTMGIAFLDVFGRVVQASSVFSRDTGLAPDVLLPDNMPEAAQAFEHALQGRINAMAWLASRDLLICFSAMDDTGETAPLVATTYTGLSTTIAAYQYNENQKFIFERDAIIDSVSEGIWVCDGQGKVLRVNPVSADLNGVVPGDVIGRTMEELEAQGLFKDCGTLEAIRTRKTVTRLVTLERRGIKVLTTSKPFFDDQGNITMVVGTERDITKLEAVHQNLAEQSALKESFQRQVKELQALNQVSESMVAKSKSMIRVVNQVVKVSPVDSSVLILGESGVGKSAIAKLIHKNSKRFQAPLLSINCAAIPESLIESELFGYVKGAFTGARDKGKIGLIEMADNGTLMLDEVAELSMASQSKLLKFLDEGRILRIGSTKKRTVDVRILAATNTDLKDAVDQGRFRLDLYYRLNVISITIPPLRERRDCILDLVNHYISHFTDKFRTTRILSPKALKTLIEYDYPGNIRELINICERIVVMTDREYVVPGDISFVGDGEKERVSPREIKPGESLPAFMERTERAVLTDARERYGSQEKMAGALGVTQPTINRKMKKYGIS